MTRYIRKAEVSAMKLFIIAVFIAALCGSVFAQDFDKKALDVDLVNQNGDRVNLYSDLIEGRTVAIAFIYTTDTTISPPMGANFSKLEKRVSQDGLQTSLIFITVDPDVDTPQRLKAWGDKFAFGGSLLTGDKSRIDKLLKHLSVFTADIHELAPFILIGNDRSKSWVRMYGLSKIEVLIDKIRDVSVSKEDN